MKTEKEMPEERCRCCRRFSPSHRVKDADYKVNGWCMRHRRGVRWYGTCAEFECDRTDEFYNVPVAPVTIFVGE